MNSEARAAATENRRPPARGVGDIEHTHRAIGDAHLLGVLLRMSGR
ncbi:hypothetical protein [Actinoplanes sp. NPDC048796]